LGVTISADAKPEDKGIFFELMAGLEERRQSIIHAKAYYDAIFEMIVQHGNGFFLKAEFEGKIISGLVVAVLKDKAWILYVANDYEYRHLMPNKLLYWEAIKLSRGLGCRFVDLGSTQGIPTFDPDNDSLDFLRKAYNPDVVTFPGYFDLAGPLYRPFIAAESVALPLLLKGHRMFNRLLKRGR
jgi:lipid II:glycine glycyltransferase (peptidoglycan interpeptide bridge formation enzyme)